MTFLQKRDSSQKESFEQITLGNSAFSVFPPLAIVHLHIKGSEESWERSLFNFTNLIGISKPYLAPWILICLKHISRNGVLDT